MNRVHLVLLWHMHQPQYRDPATGRYVLPWTRLHALKDYWGMVRLLEEFSGVHVTFNIVPSLGAQLEEYGAGEFCEPWFEIAFRSVEQLSEQDKAEILVRAFQVNHENLMSRWPRFIELNSWVKSLGQETAKATLRPRDWVDLQVLSQLAWMDEQVLAGDEEVARLARKGANFDEPDKAVLRAKQLELLAKVLPEYRAAQARGQVELSTTPYYHPILPLLCDTDVARIANPETPLPRPAFRHPEDAREQLVRALSYHRRVFNLVPTGLWPSEGSVSDQSLEIAAELGFRWFATDEGVLGPTLRVGFSRDDAGFPENADRLYSPWKIRLGQREIIGFFRDHYLSDLIGFVYGRTDAVVAAEDLHRRLRQIGERVHTNRPVTVSIFLDGENAWEYYRGNGREFLRQFYRRVESDPDIRPLTVSEAIAEAGEIPAADHIFPASWIGGNFDVWIGHAEDVAAWNLLRDTRAFYSQAEQRAAKGGSGAPTEAQLGTAYDALLAAEGSDWCWWYGPQHSSSNDAEFDAFYRTLLTEVYIELRAPAPDALAEPIKRQGEPAIVVAPASYLQVQVDGRESSYFEWLGAGLYSADRQSGAMHGRSFFLHELRYGFNERFLYVRVDPFPDALTRLGDFELRLMIRAEQELRVVARFELGRLADYLVEPKVVRPPEPDEAVTVAFERILEVAVRKEALLLGQRTSLALRVALWQGGLPLDLLPADGVLDVELGAENFAWPAETKLSGKG